MADRKKTGSPGALRRIVNLLLTLAFFAGAAGAVLAGLSFLSPQTDATAKSFAPLTTVSVQPVAFTSGYTVARRFTGQVEAAARTNLGFEPGGRITHVLVDEGDVVPAGTILARLDTSALIPERAALEADLAALAADAELAGLTLARNNTLTERGFRSVAAQDEARLALARAEAAIEAIRARIAGIDVQLYKLVLSAPFAARIGTRLADPGQTVAPGETILVLFDAAPARARVGLPPDLAAGLQAGDTVALELGGVVHPAQIRHIRPDLDPDTRSRSVVVTLPPRAAPVLGDTVALIIEQKVDEEGFWAPLSALREGARGSWAVMALETTPEGERARPAAVEVIHSDSRRVFLRGQLPPGARIVTEAPERVAPGQPVMSRLVADIAE